MNVFMLATDGFKNNKIYYSDTDSIYVHKNDHDILKTKDLIGNDLFQSKIDYGNAGIIYGLFLCPKVKYCLVINEMGFLSEKTTFKGYDQEISGVSFKYFHDLEIGQTVHSIAKLKRKGTMQGIKVPHRGINCENCLEEGKCQSCISDPKMNCFDCEITNSFNDFYGMITPKKILNRNQ